MIELLVVVSIIVILIAVSAAAFNYSINGDRVRSAARQFQSFLAGARDKAIYANEVRGVRLLLDPNDNHAVSGVQYIGAPPRETGSLAFDPDIAATGSGPSPLYHFPYDASGRTVFLRSGTGTSWASLYRRGFLAIGNRIQIPSGTGKWYTISAISTAPIQVTSTPQFYNDITLTLNTALPDLATSLSSWPYSLELDAGILGDAQPVLFPRGVVIDLDGSKIPWTASAIAPIGSTPAIIAAASYPTQMDILFTPRGTVVGSAINTGMLHFHFADTYDVSKWHSNISGRDAASYTVSTTGPIVPADAPGTASQNLVVTRDRVLATLAVRTGNVSVHYVNTSSVASSIAQDPYYFAETGQVANK